METTDISLKEFKKVLEREIQSLKSSQYDHMIKEYWNNDVSLRDIRSYQKWALKKTIEFIEINYPFFAPDESALMFAGIMDNYACSSFPKSYIFSIAYDVSVWVADVYIGIKERRTT